MVIGRSNVSLIIILGIGLYVHPVRVSKDKLYMRVTKCISSGIAFIYLVIWPCDSLLLTHTAYTGLPIIISHRL